MALKFLQNRLPNPLGLGFSPSLRVLPDLANQLVLLVPFDHPVVWVNLTLQLPAQVGIALGRLEKGFLRVRNDVIPMGLTGHEFGHIEPFVEGDPLLFSQRILDDFARVGRDIFVLLRLILVALLKLSSSSLCCLSFLTLIQERGDGDESPRLRITRPAVVGIRRGLLSFDLGRWLC